MTEYEFFPQDVADSLPPLLSLDGEGLDQTARVKFFQPWGSWTWYATEYDPKTGMFYGLVDGFCKELGYFSLNELKEVSGPMGLKIERDLYWDPTPLKALMH